MRKFLSVIVVVAMLVTGLVPGMIFSTAAASSEVEFALTATDFIENEDGVGEATVTLSITNNPGFSSATVLVYYANADLSVDGEILEGSDLYDYSGVTPNRRSNLSAVKPYFTAAGITANTATYCAVVEVMEYCDPDTGDIADSTFTGDFATFTVTTNESYADLLAADEDGCFSLPLGFIVGEVYDAEGNEVATAGATWTIDISSPEPDPFAPVYDSYAGGVTDTTVIDVAGVKVFKDIAGVEEMPAVEVPVSILNNNEDVNPVGVWSVRVFVYYDPALEVIEAKNAGTLFTNAEFLAGELNDNLIDFKLEAPNSGCMKAFEQIGFDWEANNVDFTSMFWAGDAWDDQIIGDGVLGSVVFQLPADASIGDKWDVCVALAPWDVVDYGPNGEPEDIPFIIDNGYIEIAAKLPIAEEETFEDYTVNLQNVTILAGVTSAEVGIELANNPGVDNVSIILDIPEGLTITAVESELFVAAYDGISRLVLTADAAVKESGEVATIVFEFDPAVAGTVWTIGATSTVAVDAGSITVYGGCAHGKTETTTVAPTCTDDGYTKVVCSNCGEVISTDIIPATGHLETNIVNAAAPNCTDAGYTGDEVCVACGEIVKAGAIIDALGHTSGDKVTTLAPTYTSEGAWEIKCTVCGEIVETGVIPALSMPTFTVGSANGVVGRTVTVPVSIKDNGGLFIIKLVVDYDAEVLANPSVVLGDIFTAENVIFNTDEAGRIVLYFESATDANVVGDGALAYITFEIANDEALFGAQASVGITAEEGFVVDADNNSYEVNLEGGLINLVQPETIAVEDVTVTEGEEIRVPVIIASNPGVWGIRAKISYDAWTLTLNGIESGLFAAEEGVNYSVADGVIAIFLEGADLADVTADGVLVTLVFDAIDSYETEADMELPIDIEVLEIIDVDANDHDEFVIESGVITVEPAPLGTELNPIWLYDLDTTIEIPAGATYIFKGYFNGMNIKVSADAEFVVALDNGETINANGSYEFLGVSAPRMPVTFTVTNNGETADFNIVASYPVGTMMNPEIIVDGTYTSSFEEGATEYYYQWTAPEGANTMIFSIDTTAAGWQYVIDNNTTYVYGDVQWSDSDPVVNPAIISVAAGDVIIIRVVTYDPENMWSAPAGDITITVESAYVCAHDGLVHFEAVEPGCHYDGNIEYWVCYDCETVWQDAALTQITNIKNVVLPAIGGEVVHVEAVEAACHQNGNIEYWYCENCEQVWQDEALTQLTNFKNVITPATAEIIYVAAVEASCHQNGSAEYWYCAECETVFADAALTQVTNVKNLTIPYTAEIIHVDAVEANCHQNGNVEYWYCAECEAVFTDAALTQLSNFKSVITPATAEIIYVAAVEASCHQNGSAEYWYCAECDAVFADAALTQLTNRKNLTIPATAEIIYVAAVEANCHQNGSAEYWYCAECDAVFADAALTQLTNRKNLTIPATAEIIHVEYKAPTATEDGNVEYWYCSECLAVFTDAALTQLSNFKNVIIPALGSDYITRASGTDYVKSVALDGTVITVVARPNAPYVKIAVGYESGIKVACDNIVGGGAGFSYLIIDVNEGAQIVATDKYGNEVVYTVVVEWNNVLYTETIAGYTVDAVEVLEGDIINVYAKNGMNNASVGIKLASGVNLVAPEGLDVVYSGPYVYFRAYEAAADDTYEVILTDANGNTAVLTINYVFGALVEGVQGGYMVDGITLNNNVVDINVSDAYAYASFRFILSNTSCDVTADENAEIVMQANANIHWMKIYNDGTGYVTATVYVTNNANGVVDTYTVNVTFGSNN